MTDYLTRTNQQDIETFAADHDVSLEAARRILEGRAEVSRDWQAKVAMCAALAEATAATIGDVFPDFTPRPMRCSDCDGTFIAHIGTGVEQREGPEGPWRVVCGCQDRDAARVQA